MNLPRARRIDGRIRNRRYVQRPGSLISPSFTATILTLYKLSFMISQKKYQTLGIKMRLFLAIFVPCLGFFTINRPISGLICLILQLTVIGWIPAALWSVYSLSQYTTDEKIRNLHRNSPYERAGF